jgi:hypothetical protein
MRTEPGVVMGTPGYMSPEQVRGFATDHRSDIFSFGVVLYELLSGRRAFQGETSVEVMAAIVKQEPSDLPQTLPARLRQIVQHCIEKEPNERFQSARDLRFALSQVLIESGSVAAAPRRWRTSLRFALVAALLVAAAAVVTRWMVRGTGSSRWSGVLLEGPQIALNPRLSPDGNLLAFKAFENAQTQVAVMKPESGNWSILTHHRDRGAVDQVSWSPDGSIIYYDRTTDVPHGIYSVPVLGGEEHLVLEDANSPEALPDGSLLVTRLRSVDRGQVYRFWPDTGRLQALPLERPQHSAPACARVAPGGKEAFTYAAPITGGRREPMALYAIDLASNTTRRLTFAKQDAVAPRAWTVARDGKSLILALPAGSITRVVSASTSGQSAGKTLFTVTSPVWYLEPSRDGGLFVNPVERPREILRLSSGSALPERIATFPVAGDIDEVFLLLDGRMVTTTVASGHARLMVMEKGKDPVPLVITQEPTAPPMTLAGPHEIAFTIGPGPRTTIAIADITTGRISRRITPGKGGIVGLSASVNGETLYFCAAGSVWAVSSSGGEPRAVAAGDYVTVDPSRGSLIVVRGASSHIRIFQVPLDDRPEREIPLDHSIPVYGTHAGPFSSESIDAKGRLLVSLSPFDSWFNALGILDTNSGRIDRVPVDSLSDHHSGVWTPDGGVLYTEVRMRATIWKFLQADN